MGQQSKNGGYATYNKNNKERQKEDYQSTDVNEVVNILNHLRLPFIDGDTILEPCAGGGHMMLGIINYLNDNCPNIKIKLTGTDFVERQSILTNNYGIFAINYGDKYDFLSDDYAAVGMYDYIIMNPPFSTIEPFVMKSLTMVNKGLLMFGRLKFLESQGRYENIFKNNPPSDVYIYVDRVVCYKNGDTSLPPAGIEAYSWFYWDKRDTSKETKVHWIRKYGKE